MYDTVTHKKCDTTIIVLINEERLCAPTVSHLMTRTNTHVTRVLNVQR